MKSFYFKVLNIFAGAFLGLTVTSGVGSEVVRKRACDPEEWAGQLAEEFSPSDNGHWHSKKVKLQFRKEVVLYLRLNASEREDWTHSLCCPLDLVECEFRAVDCNSSLIDDVSNVFENDQVSRPDNSLGFENEANLSTCVKGEKLILASDGSAILRIKLHGKWIGTASLKFHLFNGNNNINNNNDNNNKNNSAAVKLRLVVTVRPPKSRFGLMPTLGLFIGFSINIFGFALTTEKEDMIDFLKKPIELAVIAFAQYLMYPFMALCVNLLFSPHPIFQFMLLSTAAASAGAITNLCCILTRARLNLNILSLMITPLLGIIVVPLWVCTLGKKLLEKEFPSHKVEFPWFHFLALKGLFIAPGLLYLCVKTVIPSKCRIMSLFIRPMAFLWVCSMLVLLAVDTLWTLNYATSWRVAMGPTSLVIVGASLIFSFSYFVTSNAKTSLTVTIQGMMANPAYGILFCLTMVPKPYTPVPICITILYFLSLVSLGLIVTVITRIFYFLNREQNEPKEVNLSEVREENEIPSMDLKLPPVDETENNIESGREA